MSFLGSGPPSRAQHHKLADTLQRALAAHQLGDLVEAGRVYKIVLRKQPDHFDALHLLGMVEAQRGRPEKAERLIAKALQIDARAAEVHSNLGNVLHQLGRLQDALASYEQALRINPNYVMALNNRGNLLMALGRQQEAVESFDAAIAIEPRFAGALHNRGVAFRTLKRPLDALKSLDSAIEAAPDSFEFHVDRGSVLVELSRVAEAIAAFDRAIALEPRSAEAHYNRGVALLHQRRYAEALESFERTLALAPKHAASLSNRGNVLVQLGRLDEALASFDQAIAADPNFLTALAEKGQAALQAARYEVAAETFERVVGADGEYPYALGDLIYARMHCCDWQAFSVLRSLVEEGVRAGKPTVFPGHLLAISDAPEDQLTAARTWVGDVYPAGAAPREPRRYAHDKIRVAYLSANFHEHAMPTLLAGMFERHDRARFETTAISLGADDGSAMRARLVRAFDRFVDVRERSDQEIAELMESLEIDLAVDLMGFTQAARPGILLARPAPVQASYMGYAGTTALPSLDYLIADACVIPEAQKSYYSEHVVHLPESYYVNDDTRPIAAQTPARAEAGLPENAFVFCCFNNNYKITPDVFAIWMRILAGVEHSVLWLLKPNPAAERNLRREAEAQGIAADRLVFAPRTTPAEHLARHRLADLFLDTLPYNAHTTACDALWAGLPVLTQIGHAFASRVAASILRAIDLPELITDSEAAYEDLALRLAREPSNLAAVKEKLARNRAVKPLFDTDRFRRHMEAAYAEMVERHRRGRSPASFAVEALPQA